MNHIFDKIDNIFRDIHIYKSVIVYDASYQLEIDELVNIMKSQDYPITHLGKNSINPSNQEINTRIWAMPSHTFYKWIFYSRFNIENISVIFVIGNKSHKTTSTIENYQFVKFNENLKTIQFKICV